MTEAANRCVEALRWSHYHDDCTDENDTCPVKDECFRCDSVLCNVRIAADLIESLSAQLEQVTRERDAAVRDIRNAALCGCHVCKYYYRPDQNVRKYACKIHGSFDEHDFIADDGSIFCGAMEWRGVEANQ